MWAGYGYNQAMEKLKDYAEVVSRAERGELVFPTSVNAALRLQLALADPDCEMEDVIRKVLAEPQLAARTVALANAAAFNRGSTPVTNVRIAVQRLGFRHLYSMAASMVVRQFGSRINDPELRAKADQLWQHTAHVAALSYIIGRKLTHTDPDTALFAAIVHEAGGFYLLSCADDLPGLLEHPEQWQGAAQEIITREMMKKMAIPEPVSQAIVALRGASLMPPPIGLRDTLLVARALAPVRSPLATEQFHPSLAEFIDGNVALEQILEESADDAASMSAALLA